MEFRPNGSSADAVAVWMSRLDSDDERAAQSREIAALVELAIAGDSAAFEQIVMRTEHRQRKPRETCRSSRRMHAK